MQEPIWVTEARSHIGKSEVAGLNSDKWILSLWETVPWIWSTVARKDDGLLAWCGAFVRFIMVQTGIEPPKNWWSAASWANWGTPLKSPILGCVGVMKRKGGAHVTIIIGKDYAGNLIGLGGNQGDMVKKSAFKPEFFTAFVWPPNQAIRLTALPHLSAAPSMSEV
jgi:uncharacterized protein (TIGR02594 family)